MKSYHRLRSKCLLGKSQTERACRPESRRAGRRTGGRARAAAVRCAEAALKPGCTAAGEHPWPVSVVPPQTPTCCFLRTEGSSAQRPAGVQFVYNCFLIFAHREQREIRKKFKVQHLESKAIGECGFHEHVTGERSVCPKQEIGVAPTAPGEQETVHLCFRRPGFHGAAGTYPTSPLTSW